MIVSDSDYLKQLEIVRKIRETIKAEDEINLPQICVIGDQSSGKSSFLSRLTGVSFPTAAKMCTKAAVVVTCIHDPSLSAPKYEIEDWERPGSYLETKTTAEAIKATQDKLLRKKSGSNGNAWNDDENMIVADQSIKLRVTGADVIDIIIVDLPGIQHAGSTKDAIEALIEENIKKPETLNLLVSEAKQDAELTKAIEIAEKYDPNHERTIRVLSKFDNFDTPETQHRAVSLVRDGLNPSLINPTKAVPQKLNLGPHAVISIGEDGKLRVDKNGEVTERVQLTKQYQVPESRAGITTLKERLQPLFAFLIKKYLPLLKQKSSECLNVSRASLEKVGEESISPFQMIMRCMHCLQIRVDKFEKKVSQTCFLLMKDEVNKVKAQITFENVTSFFEINSFHCVLFQGQHEFEASVRKIRKLWEPIVNDYIENIRQTVLKAFKCLWMEETTKEYGKLISVIQAEYQEYMQRKVLPRFKDACLECLNDEDFYATTNHYFNSKFREEEICPKALVDVFVKKAKVMLEDDDKSQPHSHNKNFRRVNVTHIRDCLEEAKKEVASADVHSNLMETQKKRVFSAVQANFDVEKKTFVDNLLKKTKGILIKGHVDWVQTHLHRSKTISDAAVEDDNIVKYRQDLIAKIKRLEDCLHLLRDVLLPDTGKVESSSGSVEYEYSGVASNDQHDTGGSSSDDSSTHSDCA